MYLKLFVMKSTQIRTVPALIFRHSICSTSQSNQKVNDPIQQLFLDKIQEYKKKSGGNKWFEISPEIERERQTELEKLARNYGGNVANMDSFPNFKFEDPPIDDIRSK